MTKSWWPKFDLWDHHHPLTHNKQTNQQRQQKEKWGNLSSWAQLLSHISAAKLHRTSGEKLELAIAMINYLLLLTTKKAEKNSLGICFSKNDYWGHHEQKHDLCFSVGSWSKKRVEEKEKQREANPKLCNFKLQALHTKCSSLWNYRKNNLHFSLGIMYLTCLTSLHPRDRMVVSCEGRIQRLSLIGTYCPWFHCW